MSEFPDAYEERLAELNERCRDYEVATDNWQLGQTLLCCVDDLFNAVTLVNTDGPKGLQDEQKLQLFFTGGSINVLEAIYLLTSHQHYNSARARQRYLYEVYLLLRGLNQNREIAATKFREIQEQAHRVDYETSRTELVGNTPVAKDEFWELVKEQRREVRDVEETLLWDHPTWEGIHPQSIVGLWADGQYNSESEKQLFQLANTYAFGIAAQFIEAIDTSDYEAEVKEELAGLFVRVKLSLEAKPPRLFDDDLRKYW